MDKSLRARWATLPSSWCTLPIKGNGHGPGGKFLANFLVFKLVTASLTSMDRKKRKVSKAGNEGNGSFMVMPMQYLDF